MSIELLIALFSAVGLIGASAVSGVVMLVMQLWKRINVLEAQIQVVVDRESRILWWALSLRDHYYRYRRPDAPDLPEIPDLDTTKEPTQ